MVHTKALSRIASSLKLISMDYKSEAEVKKNLQQAIQRWKVLKVKASNQ